MNYQHNKKYSNIGEKIAINYLKKHGYKIISTNTRINSYEVDIIANISYIIVFIEVKTRLSKKYESAEYHFSHRKLINLKNVIKKYCFLYNLSEERIKLEFIAINLNTNTNLANIKHFLLVT